MRQLVDAVHYREAALPINIPNDNFHIKNLMYIKHFLIRLLGKFQYSSVRTFAEGVASIGTMYVV